MEQLNAIFRDLVKKYHPDKVKDDSQWANERMAEINNAYEVLAAWLSVLPEPEAEEETEPGTDHEESTREFRQSRPEKPPLAATQRMEFNEGFGRFLDGLGLYFEYGLENPAYRGEGVRRFRFREALRSIDGGCRAMEACARTHHHRAIKTACHFVQLTAADIRLGELRFSGGGTIGRFDSRLRSARRVFDGAVKEILFPELVPDHLRGRNASSLYSCYAEFVLYFGMFDGGERRSAGFLQVARYNAFLSLLEFRSSGILSF